MYAILAYKLKFSREGQADRTFCEFKLASMGCFNGINDQNAFTYGWSYADRDLIMETGPAGTPMLDDTTSRIKAWGFGSPTSNNAMAFNREMQGWQAHIPEFIGLGYLSYLTAANQKTFAQLQPAVFVNPTNNKNDPYVGSLLMREGFLSPYRCPVFGGTAQTIRELTPNELYLNEVCRPIHNGTINFIDTLRDTQSKMAVTMTANRAWCGQLYQMVGSERPSGQAVAYLQAWRNCSEYSTSNGFTNDAAQRGVCQWLGSNGTLRQQSVIAVLSTLFHHGDDSDIITFAGNHYLSYCAKVGFWNTKHLYRNQNDMVTEGRYNKGGQSSAVRENLHRLRSMRSRSDTHGLWTLDLGRQMEQIKRSMESGQQVAYDTNMATLQSYCDPRYASRRAELLQRITAGITAMWNSNPQQQLTEYYAQASQLPDLRIAPTGPVAPPVGFTQWVAQETEILH